MESRVGAPDFRRWSNILFAGLFLVAVILFGRILLPFLMPVLLGAFLVVLFMPVMDFLRAKLGGRRSISAAVSTALVFLVLLAPLAAVGFLVAREMLDLAEHGAAALAQGQVQSELASLLPHPVRRFLPPDIQGDTARAVVQALTGSAGTIARLLGIGTELAINFFLAMVSMYYFFIDGRRLWHEATRLVPLDRRYIQAFAKEFRDVTHAIVWGNTLTALVQGVVGFAGLMIVGVDHALVWGAAMVVVALIPLGGTALIWGPLGIALIMSGRTKEGLFVLAWGAFIVSTVDNFVRPRLCGSRMALHPLLVFLSMFGGLAVFGMMGLLVGPLIASIFMTMVRIYRRDFHAVVFAEPAPAPVPPAGPPAAVHQQPVSA